MYSCCGANDFPATCSLRSSRITRAIPVGMAMHYLAWKFLVRSLNAELEIGRGSQAMWTTRRHRIDEGRRLRDSHW